MEVLLEKKKGQFYISHHVVFGSDRYVYDTDGSDDFTNVYFSSDSLSCVHYICTAFLLLIISQ